MFIVKASIFTPTFANPSKYYLTATGTWNWSAYKAAKYFDETVAQSAMQMNEPKLRKQFKMPHEITIKIEPAP